jgi:hypothetical protein
MLTIFATIGWLLFDVWVSIVTAPILPLWEWRAIFWGGIGLAISKLAGALLDRRAHRKEIENLMRGQATHSQEHDTLASGIVRLAQMVNTSADQPSGQIAQAAI